MAKEYAILRIEKITSGSGMTHRYEHNMRIGYVENADPALSEDNIIAQDFLNGRTYSQSFTETVSELRALGTMGGVRKNAVLGFEVICRYSHEANERIDPEAWIRKNVEWLNRTFNPPDGTMTYLDRNGREQHRKTNNVKSIIVHMDEGTPHIHAFVVPVDAAGRLNSQPYIGKPYMLGKMQDDYAKAMEEFGLSRGEYKSIATPQKIRKYYTLLNKAVEAELPPVRSGETAEEYRTRAQEVYQTTCCNHRDEIVKKDQEIVAAYSDARASRRKMYKEKEETDKFRKKLAGAVGKDELTDRDIPEIADAVMRDRDFRDAVAEHPDREAAEAASVQYNQMSEWARKQRKKQRRKYRNIEHQ